MASKTKLKFEFIPLDLERVLEEAMNEPLPDVPPIDENFIDFASEDGTDETPTAINDILPSDENIDLASKDIKDDTPVAISGTQVDKPENQPNSNPSNVSAKNPLSKTLIKIENFKENLKSNKASDMVIENMPYKTPIRKINNENLRPIKEDVNMEDETSFDFGFSSLSLQTPVRCLKAGNENLLNSQPQLRQHSIGRTQGNFNSFRTPDVKLSNKFSLSHKKVDNFRTPFVPLQLEPAVISTSKRSSSNFIQDEFSRIRVKGVEYIILKEIGRGGSSVVHQCFDPISKENRAIKCVTLESSSTSEGYIKEIELLRKLQSCDRIIKLHGYEHMSLDDEKKLYVVLEMGSTDLAQILRDFSKRTGSCPGYLIQFYWMEMLYAVQQIHSHKIIHSDLKPANFLLVDGRLKLIDFGISSCLGNDRTSVIKTVSEGSCNYISPEALNPIYSTNQSSPNYGKPKYKINVKADVWSLGCILYQLLYKRTPFQHITNLMQKLMTIANPSVKVQYPHNDKIPKKFSETVKRCLQFNPELRPSVFDLIREYE